MAHYDVIIIDVEESALVKLYLLVGVLLLLPAAMANSYVADLGFVTSKTVYIINETLELKGTLYLTNSSNGTLVANHTGLVNTTVNISILYVSTNATYANYTINTTTGGEFYSQSTYYPSAPLVPAPMSEGSYYVKAMYADPNGTVWWTRTEILVVNKTLDRIEVSTDKIDYSAGEAVTITVEAVKEIGDKITYTANVSVNGSVRNSTKAALSTFNCTTGASGKCSIATTAPSTYGDYLVEVNNFKSFSSFSVKRFDVNIAMKDELGKSIKHIFNTAEQASVEVGAITNITADTYAFNGVIKGSSGAVIKNITSTTLNYNNSFINRFTFTLDALTFPIGTYYVEVNVTKTGDGTVGTFTSFEVKDWDLLLKKRELNSGFEYEYSAFPNRTINMEFYPTWRANGTMIDNVNTTTSVNISLIDKMNNRLATTNASLNATCGKQGCYNFSLTTPASAGEYYVSLVVSYSTSAQYARQSIRVIGASVYAQSTDKDGALKDLFNSDDYAYISLSAKNTTADKNLTDAGIVSVVYMNGTEYSYAQVGDFSAVNATNNQSEWAWNASSQRLKLDTPSAGGVYTVYVTAENNTAAASAKFIVNPYDACIVAKNTAGQVSGGYYYVYQFKTTDTVYFEMKIVQANNPTGRAAFMNTTNSSYGMGSQCADLSSTRQVINNATITVDSVTNMQTGKTYVLNASASGCQADNNKGGYTCIVKPMSSWDGGAYGVKFKVLGTDGKSDISFGGFEARAFYLYAWSTNWYAMPAGDITLNVYMYEAGNNWWGSYGSGGLGGTVTLEKIEYQGREGEWLWPPIVSDYNASLVNTSTITNGQGTMTLQANHTASGQWKTGYYRAILKGTDSGGTSDYGYAWFAVKRWETYASPVDCSSGTCISIYNVNSKDNISLYVTINNAGQWGQAGNSIGGEVLISVKKLQDCRKWPCTDYNSSKFNSTAINVSKSSGWYWSGNVNRSYIINLTPNSGSWGTGYWSAVLDINGTETGSGWFNTIAFYVETQATNSSGTGWKNSIKNNEPMYFKVTTTKSQKGGYYYGSYNTSDYLNTTIDSAVLKTWNSTSQRQIEFNYPRDFNISIQGGGTVINGSNLVNVTYLNGSWPSGYYWGEMTLKNSENETATGWLWFEARPFRVQVSSSQYNLDNDACINGTIMIYNPDWSINTLMNGTYNITSVTENTWSGSGYSITSYTNYTPSNFTSNASFSICPNTRTWSSGSWGNYHYLTISVRDNESNSQDGWLSFRALPFSVSWGSISGGTNVLNTNNVAVPVTLTKPTSGASTHGNLSKLYQWRSDLRSSSREEYVFSVGDCYSNVSGSCMVNGTQTVNIYAPSAGWKEGYNYLQAEWFETSDSSSTVQDYSGVWFNGQAIFNGWHNNVDENGYYKYYFAQSDNMTFRLYVRDSSSNPQNVNVTRVQYSNPSTSCWDEYCRTYNDATYTIVGRANTTLYDNAIIKATKSGNWSTGNIYFKVTVRPLNSTATSAIKGISVFVKDFTVPSVNLTVPVVNTTITSATYWMNWTSSESATCSVRIHNYDDFNRYYCSGWNVTNSTNGTIPNPRWLNACNATKYVFNGSVYYNEYISDNYHSWYNGLDWSWQSGSTGLVTGGITHYYQASTAGLTINQSYGLIVSCNDQDWNYQADYTAFRFGSNSSSSSGSNASNATNVTLVSYSNNTALASGGNVTFNYSFTGPAIANCSLYGNFSSNWALNMTTNNISTGASTFRHNLTAGRYIWNSYCVNAVNSTDEDWGDANWTLIVNNTV